MASPALVVAVPRQFKFLPLLACGGNRGGAWRAHQLRLLTEQAEGVDSGVKRMIVNCGGPMLLWRMTALGVDALGAAGLAYEPDGETDDATAWNLDYMFDIGMIIGGGSSNIQKSVIGERGLGLPRA